MRKLVLLTMLCCGLTGFVYAGFVVEDAMVDSLYEDPRHPYTFSLLRSLPKLTDEPGEPLETIEGLPPDLLELPAGCPFVPRCSFAKDKCSKENPGLVEISLDHKIACWIDIKTGELR